MRKTLSLFLLAALFISTHVRVHAQDLYEISTIQDIRITFTQSNWDYQLDTAKAGAEGYIVASEVLVNGVSFVDVGVKYKGNSTYSANNAKNPLHIELDYIHPDQNYLGYADIKLSNAWADPSFVREVLGFEVLRHYMDAPQANYANVHINGNLIGLYSSAEAINKKFVGDHFYSSNNTLVKGNPVGGAGPQGTGYPDLVYNGTAISSYNTKYEVKSDSGWEQLIHLCDTLKNYTGQIEKILDVDRALWMLAFNDVTVNLDSYTGSFRQNYYLYYDNNNRFNPVIWDLNMCFGSFSNLGSSTGGGGGGLSATAMAQMTVFPHITENGWPLIYYLMQNARYKKMYMAHVRTMANEMIGDGWLSTRASELQSIISADVTADPNKFYTTANFTANLNSAVSGGGGGPGGGQSFPGVVSLMTSRYSYLQSEANFILVGPEISNVTASNTSPAIGEEIWITATISNATYAYLGHRANQEKIFEKVEMFDDGAHHDGAAGDGVYGASLNVASAITQYYVYADNSDAGKFSPQRAEHEFYELLASVAPVLPGQVVINEFVASNLNGATDTDGEQDDWIELYNTTSNDIALYGTYLSDDAANLPKWAFPADAVIPANGYLIVWADENGGETGIHANFKLSAGGESLHFTLPDGTVIDEVVFGQQTTDRSMALCPNGTGDFTANVVPTFNAENTCVVSVGELANAIQQLYPNPANEQLQVVLDDNNAAQYAVYTASGALQNTGNIRNGRAMIDTASLADGLYLLHVTQGSAVFTKSFLIAH